MLSPESPWFTRPDRTGGGIAGPENYIRTILVRQRTSDASSESEGDSGGEYNGNDRRSVSRFLRCDEKQSPGKRAKKDLPLAIDALRYERSNFLARVCCFEAG